MANLNIYGIIREVKGEKMAGDKKKNAAKNRKNMNEKKAKQKAGILAKGTGKGGRPE